MSVDSNDLLHLAHALCADDCEVKWRTGVSRAYYAAYHACTHWHSAMPVPGSVAGPSGGIHQVLINQLKNGAPEWSPDQRALGRRLAVQLATLKDRRVLADYDLCAQFDQALAQADCARTGLICAQL